MSKRFMGRSSSDESISSEITGQILSGDLVTGNNALAQHEALVVTNGTTAATQMDIDATSVLLRDSSRNLYRASSVNLTATITGSGANGLDTGAEGSSTWYYLYVIYNSSTDTVASLISASATSPTMPSGYTYKGLVGAVFNDSGSNFLTLRQYGKEAVFDVPIRDSATAFTTTAALVTCTVPPNTHANIFVLFSDTTTQYALVTETWQTDTLPTSTIFNLSVASAANANVKQCYIRVDASSQIRVRADANVSSSVIQTIGWRWE